MKKLSINSIQAFIAGLFVFIIFHSCEKSESMNDAVYITGADVGNLSVFYASENASSYAVSATATNLAEKDEEIVFVPSPELVEDYNRKFKGSYVALPADKYDFPKSTAIIKSGEMRSESLNINITDKEIFEKGPVYMLPMTIQKKTSDGYQILEGSKTLYIAIAKGTEGSVLELQNGRVSPLKFLGEVNPELRKMTNVTLEGRVKFNNISGFLPTLFGTEESYLIRIESSDASSGFFPIAGPGGKSQLSVSTGVWYHVAAVRNTENNSVKLYINGREHAFSSIAPNSTQDLSFEAWMGFHIGAYNKSNGRSIGAQFSEVRLWSTARTQSELITTACVVDPSTPGLEAYWRLNEGSGDQAYDSSGNGHNASIHGSYSWVPGVKCGSN